MKTDTRKHSHFDLQLSLGVPVAMVYEHLAEPKNYMGLQVLLTSMSDVTLGVDATGHTTKAYETVETFRRLGIPIYSNRIQVIMTLSEPGHVLVSKVRSAPNLDITATYTFEAEGEGTLLTLSFEILSAPWLASMVVAEAQRVQKLLLAKLKERIER